MRNAQEGTQTKLTHLEVRITDYKIVRRKFFRKVTLGLKNMTMNVR